MVNEVNEVNDKEKCHCSYCLKATDGTQFSYDKNDNKLYFCSPLHHFKYFQESDRSKG